MSGNIDRFGVTAGKVVTIDDEIAQIEWLVEQRRIERMVNLATERVAPGTVKVHLMTLATPLEEVRAMLAVAQEMVDAMIGKAEG